MNCLNILNSSVPPTRALGCITLLLVVVQCCLTTSMNDEGLPQAVVSVPFNDLLPPLTDVVNEKEQASLANTTATTTTKTTNISIATKRPPAAIPAPAVKPTKPLKKQQLKKIQQQQLQTEIPILDLNPEVPPSQPMAEVSIEPFKVAELKQSAESTQIVEEKYQMHKQQLQPQKQQQHKLQPKQQFVKQLQQLQTLKEHKLQPQIVARISKIAKAASPQITQLSQKELNIEQLQQYLHPTTRRPSRGALPTLTPFPRHLK